MNMNPNEELSELERRTRAVLEESVARIDARTRSRLNQARHAALAAAAAPRTSSWRGLRLMPATGAVAAAVLVALMLFSQRPQTLPTDGAQPTVDVLDLLADDDGLSLMEDEDHAFYEWAAAQDEAGTADAGVGAGATG
jgi:anti-sigma-K factor RskA